MSEQLQTTNPVEHSGLSHDQIEDVANQFHHEIKVQKLAMETGVATEDIRRLFTAQSSGDITHVDRLRNMSASDKLLSAGLDVFLMTIFPVIGNVVNIGIDLSSHERSFFFTLKEDDFESRSMIYQAESRANDVCRPGAQYRTIIVEEDDEICMPSNFTDMTSFFKQMFSARLKAENEE